MTIGYGDAFADVYDEWYPFEEETDATIGLLLDLAAGLPILELGVGTGRLAVPLAQRHGATVWGVDDSAAMLDQLHAKPGGAGVTTVLADLADLQLGLDAPHFGAAVLAWNTLFLLLTEQSQTACLTASAAALAPGGALVVEAFVPGPGLPPAGAIEVAQIEPARAVLKLATTDPADPQVIRGQHVDISPTGISLRPWSLRPLAPGDLDRLATKAGLTLESRWANWARQPFLPSSPRHISIYRR